MFLLLHPKFFHLFRNMFDFLFGWRKASKCKKLLKRVQRRLKLLKNKRHSIVRQLREDVAQLIKIGYEDIAFNRAEQLFEDENTMAVYELLDNFCEFILKNLPYIRRNKDCPNDVNEAVSSLIFASTRCGNLPELRVIRKLFGERYGQRLETTALELLPGNLVNFQIKERMSIQSVPADVKHCLVDEIARDYCLREEILALEYIPEQQQMVENIEFRASDAVVSDNCRIEESQIQVSSTANDSEVKAIYIDLASTRQSSSFESQPRQDCDVISTSVSPSAGRFSSTDNMDSPVHKKEADVNSLVEIGPEHRSEVSALICYGNKEFQMITASSSESSPHFPDEMIVYLDDVEEVQSSITKDGSFQDQIIFKFKSVLPKPEKIGNISDLKYLDQIESLSAISCRSRNSNKSKPTSRRSKTRSISSESPTLKDIDSEMYYNKPCRKLAAHKHRLPCQAQKRRKGIRHSQELQHCCLKHPCNTNKRGGRIHSQKLRRKCNNFHNRQSSGSEELDTEHFVRAMTMPQDRCKESQSENVVRSRSFPVQSPSHIHPNLPDYDDITAKFRALKEEHLRSKCVELE